MATVQRVNPQRDATIPRQAYTPGGDKPCQKLPRPLVSPQTRSNSPTNRPSPARKGQSKQRRRRQQKKAHLRPQGPHERARAEVSTASKPILLARPWLYSCFFRSNKAASPRTANFSFLSFLQ
mmetsp:Transcript_60919/g.137753  ORF Transcript_60919/g.137753 Transcript_60919/m.137753 type:complete len:123 (-) Transcript_60919:2175-2543(-)